MDESPASESLSFRVRPDLAGLRLDACIHRVYPQYSRATIKSWFGASSVTYNGHPVSASLRVRDGSDVRVFPPPVAAPDRPVFPLKVLYEDDLLVAVDKPPGVPTHPLKPGERGTVLESLVARFPEVSKSGPSALEGGLLHRLDNDTSGVLLAARTSSAWHILRAALHKAGACKEYLAVVCGNLPCDCVVDHPVAHSDRVAGRSVAIFPDGYRPPPGATRVQGDHRGVPRKAMTEVIVLEHRNGFTLVRARVQKAVTHQVRVHLAALGHPIAGDDRYLAGTLRDSGLTIVPRLALHAASLAFEHPLKEGLFIIESPMAADLARAWSAL